MTKLISNQELQELLLLLQDTDGSQLDGSELEEELAELGELELDDEEEMYRELALAIADGKPILGSTTTLPDYDFGDGYE